MAVSTVSFTSCEDDDYYYVNIRDLPPTAYGFINTFFYNDYVDDIRAWGYGNDTSYAVYFDSGAVVYFDAWGNWYEVDAPFGYTIPYGIAPYQIANYVAAYWPYEGINSIVVEYFGYSVVLTDGTRLSFDTQGYPL